MKDAVRVLSITRGAEYEIDLARFPEAEPLFAYVDDAGSMVRAGRGLVPYGWLTLPEATEETPSSLPDPRHATLLKACRDVRDGDKAIFLSLGAGEFWLEIHHVAPDGATRLLRQDDWCFK
jgi:hypothetical protein